MRPSSGRGVGLAVFLRGQADAGATHDDPSDEEKAVRALEWQVVLAQRAAEVDRQRRLQAVAVKIAEVEHRARRDAARHQRAVRLAQMRGRSARDTGTRERPTVDVARLDLSNFRIERL